MRPLLAAIVVALLPVSALAEGTESATCEAEVTRFLANLQRMPTYVEAVGSTLPFERHLLQAVTASPGECFRTLALAQGEIIGLGLLVPGVSDARSVRRITSLLARAVPGTDGLKDVPPELANRLKVLDPAEPSQGEYALRLPPDPSSEAITLPLSALPPPTVPKAVVGRTSRPGEEALRPTTASPEATPIAVVRPRTAPVVGAEVGTSAAIGSTVTAKPVGPVRKTTRTVSPDRIVSVEPVPQLSERILFGFDSAWLHPRSRKALDRIAERAAALDGQLELTGFASPIGDPAHNLRLSQWRVGRVRDHLIRSGVPADRIVTVARGESDERATGEEARRVDIRIVPDV